MLVEAHLGSRPGRPIVLLIASAAVLAAGLGLAFVQAKSKRALGPEVQLPGTPLVFRPPAHWSTDDRRPGEYYLTLHAGDSDTRAGRVERRVRYVYRRHATFVSPESIIEQLDASRSEMGVSSEPTETVIAGLPGLQVLRKHRTYFRGQALVVESVVRVACSPGGDEVRIDYTPFTRLTYGDLDLLDDLCAAMRLDGPRALRTPQAALSAAGIQATLPANAHISGADFDGTAGFFVGALAPHQHRHAFGVFRTWLPADRKPADLARDFAGEIWQIPPDALPVAEWRRGDQSAVYWMRNAGRNVTPHPIRSIGIVAKSAVQAAIVYVFADGVSADEADAAGRMLLDGIEFVADVPDDLEKSTAAGTAFATKLRERGGTPWWGRGAEDTYYEGNLPTGNLRMKRSYVGIGENAAAGYEGREIFDGDVHHDDMKWKIDGTAAGYSQRWLRSFGDAGMELEIHEQRSPKSKTVQRTLLIGGRQAAVEFEPGPAFVPPPLETLVVQNAQSRDAQPDTSWLVEQSVPTGDSTHFVLVRTLSRTDDGGAVVLVQDDFWPPGSEHVFTKDELRVLRPAGGGELTRISAAQGERWRGLRGDR